MTTARPTTTPQRQIRALFDDTTITVYQAYPPAIADAALGAGTFVEPFRRGRMTWIKPSFFWMMYRSGWAEKPDQERVLAVSVSRIGFEWALEHSCPSAFDPALDPTYEAWRSRKDSCPVRVQWDPERSPSLEPRPWRAIQIGLSGEAVDRYLDSWIQGIVDVTADARPGGPAPEERPYPLPARVAAAVGASAEPGPSDRVDQ